MVNEIKNLGNLEGYTGVANVERTITQQEAAIFKSQLQKAIPGANIIVIPEAVKLDVFPKRHVTKRIRYWFAQRRMARTVKDAFSR